MISLDKYEGRAMVQNHDEHKGCAGDAKCLWLDQMLEND